MVLSETGLAFIKSFESFRGSVYPDDKGIPTIGYGHRLLPGERFPHSITEPEAEAILAKDTAKAQNTVSRVVRVAMTQGMFDALVSFEFNVGEGSLEESTLLRDLNNGQEQAAALQLLRWDHEGAVESAGLLRRRKGEYKLWTGQDAPPDVAPHSASKLPAK